MVMRVPEIQEQFRYKSPQVPAARLKGMDVQTSADMFGAQSGKQMEKAGYMVQRGADQLGRLYVDYQDTKATEEFMKFQEQASSELHGEGGVFSMRGEAALDAPGKASVLLEQRAAEHRKNLSGLGESLFDGKLARYRASVMPQAARHAADQRNEWMGNTYKAKTVHAADMAVTNFTDENAYRMHIAEGRDAVRRAGELAGLPQEAIQQNISEFTSGVYMKISGAHVSKGSYAAAERLMKGGVMSGADVLKMEEHISSKKKIDASYAYTLEQRREREALKKFDDTQTALLEGGQIDEARQNALNAPSGYKQDSLRLVQNYAEGKRVVNDDATEWDIRQQMANDPEGFIRDWDPIKQRGKLDNSTIDYFNKQYEVLSKGGREAKSMHDSVVEDSRRLTEARVVMFGKSSFEKLNEEEKKREINFTRIFQERVDMEAIDKKRKLSGTEKKIISDEMLVEHGKESKWFTRDKVTYAFESAIPERDVARIRQELKDNGYPDTEMNIRKAYEHQQKGKK